MPAIAHEIKIKASPDRVYEALTTADGMRAWHTTSVDGTGEVGSVWQLRFDDGPDFDWRVVVSEPVTHVKWECVQGPGDAPHTTVDFSISPADDERALLECTHDGWPHDGGNFRKCNTLWAVLLHHLRMYAETGERATPFDG